MLNKIILTIDVGTSIVKSSLIDLSGNEVANFKIPNHSTIYGHNTAECDMEALWKICSECIEQTIKQAVDVRANIAAVCVAGNMVGLWPLGKNGEVYTRALLWNDGRSVGILKRWRDDGISEKIFNQSGNALTPGFTLPLLRWCVESAPEKLEKAHTIFFCKDFIRYKLTGEIATDETDASHAPGDLRARIFSDTLFQLCGVGSYRSLFPKVLKSGECAGFVSRDISEKIGLPAGIPVLAGMADVSAMLTGAGACGQNPATLVLGTSCLCTLTADEPDLSSAGIGLSFLLPEGRYVRSFPNQTGTLALNWFIKEFIRPGVSDDKIPWKELENEIENKIPDGSAGLIFHPYLNSTGVISPIYQPEARGRIWGLQIGHTAMHLLKAIYEGLGYAIADCLGQMQLPQGRTICTVGGGANSEFLCQLISDITGMQIQTLKNDEIGALGLTMLAGQFLGEWSSLREAGDALLRFGKLYSPSEDRHAFYIPLLEQYKLLRANISQEYKGG